MTFLARLRSLLAGLFKRERIERSMSDEMRFHLDAFADDLVRSGVPRPEAERRARVEFGGLESSKERCREARGLRWVDDLRGDLRYASRTLAGSAAFTLTAVLTLALGIGVNTGLFTLVDTLLMRPVPVRDPWSLYQVFGLDAHRATAGSFSLREYDDVAMSGVFSQMIADSPVRARLRNQALGGYAVSGNYFPTLGAGTVVGRPIVPDDELPSASPVVVLGHARWQSMFALGADAGRVLWTNLREGLQIIAWAVGGGLVVALVFARILRAMLFRVGASDPMTLLVAPGVLVLVALIAIYVPSRRATRVEPNVALRVE